MNNSVERFSNRVANYVKYRPSYPSGVVSYLEETCGLSAESLIADIGCGTGLSSRLFLEHGQRVIGVEPNEVMREAASRYLADFPQFEILDGNSNATTLPESAVDLVVAAQAFHWFDPVTTRSEFHRILKPGGHIVLIWNERQLDTTPFLVQYETLLLRYANDYTNVRHENVDNLRLSDFYQSDYTAATFENFQDLDFEGLKGRMLSSSYMPDEASGTYGKLVDELQSIFAKHAENGRIRILYDTNVYTSQV